jgi:hypothetical protein
MTTDEFSNEMDARLGKYDLILNEYEKSIYLTVAQTNLVKSYFTVGIERSSKLRTDLKELIQNYISETKIVSSNNISDDSKFFKVPDNVFVIIQEQCNIISDDDCINGTLVDVVPKTHDEYNTQSKNPFRKPDSSIVWRLDYNSQGSVDGNVELISSYDISKYRVRYISYPEPIVLTNLSTGSFGEGLSIDGVTTYQTCKLDESIHREILDIAIGLAMADYKPQTAQPKK